MLSAAVAVAATLITVNLNKPPVYNHYALMNTTNQTVYVHLATNESCVLAKGSSWIPLAPNQRMTGARGFR